MYVQERKKKSKTNVHIPRARRMTAETFSLMKRPTSNEKARTYPWLASPAHLAAAREARPRADEEECALPAPEGLPACCRRIISLLLSGTKKMSHGSPFCLFVVRVRKKPNLLVVRENQSEGPFHAVMPFVLVDIPTANRGSRLWAQRMGS
jgi:hypothetical protein